MVYDEGERNGGTVLNIDHLEAFMYVVQFKSIHKAADALFLSQPTVTGRIQTLERELDTQLFARKGRRLVLTERGREFIPYAEQIIQTLKEGKQMLKERNEQEEIVIGANIITSQYFIPFALPLWKLSNPGLQFKFVSASNDVLLEKVLRQQVDLAFMKEISNDGLQKHQLLDNSVRLVVYPDHPLLHEENVTARRLADESMVFFECGAFDWHRIRKLFEAVNVEPRIEFQVDHMEVAKSLIKNRFAVGFLPYLSIKEELKRGELIEIDVTHLINIEQHVFLTYSNQNVTKWQIWKDIKESVEAFL